MNGNTLYFGRGSSSCIAVTLEAGEYAKVFVGSAKTGEMSDAAMFDRSALFALSEFFMAVWREHGQNIYVGKLKDDPHDSIHQHDFDMHSWEAP